MKKYLFLLLFFAAGIIHGSESPTVGQNANVAQNPAGDFVEVTSQSALWASTSSGAAHPDRIRIRAHIRYQLTGSDSGRVAVALNDKGEMDFSTFDIAPVTRGSGELELKGEVRMFETDTLRCMVVLTKSAPSPTEKPLAVTYLSIDLKQLRATRQRR